MIDVSGSMSSNGRMQAAINAAQAVLATFSNNDFVGFIQFSGSASPLLNGQIKRATTEYKEELKNAID